MPIISAADVANSTSAYITGAQNTANTAITTLNLAANSWTATNWADIGKPATGPYTQFSENDATIKTALDTFDTALALIVPPGVLPTAPGVTGYTTPVWNDSFWTNLKSLLTTFTSNITGSDDVDTVVTKLTSETTKLQVALFATDRERRQQGLRDAFSAANAAVGARGFTHPNSMTTALRLGAQQQFMFDLSQTSRDLVKQIFEWAKSNYQFTVEKQISAHTADVDFNMRYAEVLIRVYDTELRGVLTAYREKVAGEISKAEQKIKNYATRLEAIKTNAGVVSEKDRIESANFGTEVQQHVASVAKSVETAASNARNKIEAAVAAVNAAANMVSSASQISIGVLNG